MKFIFYGSYEGLTLGGTIQFSKNTENIFYGSYEGLTPTSANLWILSRVFFMVLMKD